MAQHTPGVRVALTKTGATTPGGVYGLQTPEGLAVTVREIATALPKLLYQGGHKNEHLVKRFYEDTIDDPGNQVWSLLATQYACAIGAAGIPHVLAQSINPLVSLLKAHDLGLLGKVHLTGVINDSGPDFTRRFDYLARQITGGAQVTVIAVSESVRQELCAAGVPEHAVRKVLNGMDIDAFTTRLRHAEAAAVWERVRSRNKVPQGLRVMLVCARRVAWKGHQDVIHAARILAERGRLEGTCVVFNGAGMLDSRAPGYQQELQSLIADLDLDGKVFLLDELTPEEVMSCYVGAHVAVHPSRKPEPFGYANLEAMLAGVPVIATAHGGPLEYIEHGVSGLLVPPHDPDQIAVALEALLGDDALHARMGRAGRVSAERFSLDAMFDGYHDAITTSEALHGGGR
ncbi:glycosyltransferase family 4 protein [Nonomuraea sp. MG754425]|uniref:glycosyltransferase family 4 protein n=1 Tax=Nonomuraea sp. MG754425 TaxID=2570319 RepID=UPI001F40C952|nr:glycosyltransferase family 4 protein [Nonomuraea sp. MG754425]